MSTDYVFAGSRFLGKDFMKKSKIPDSAFTVASVEAGNTTTKCIITATDMDTGKTTIVGRCVRLTRDIRKPADNEKIFGKTISGTPLTKEALSELIRDTVRRALFENNLTVGDIHFAVRSTGITAETGEQLEMIILAMADGCLLAGLTPRKMTGYLSPDKMPEKLRPYSQLEKVYFDGAVAGVRPPAGLGESIISNEMEGELALAGLKEAGKHIGTDFRNPCIAIDMGTTLSGRITDGSKPYAKTIGNFCGYAGAVVDALVRDIAPGKKSALELIRPENADTDLPKDIKENISQARSEIMNSVRVIKIPDDRARLGPFAVNAAAAKKAGVTLIGCDVGENGSDFEKLSAFGKTVYDYGGLNAAADLADEVMSDILTALINCIRREGLADGDMTIGVTGRAGTSGHKKELARTKLKAAGILNDPETQLFFAEDGLARGAAVMARCMNSLGCPNNPIGGNRGDKCIMAERIKFQNLQVRDNQAGRR